MKPTDLSGLRDVQLIDVRLADDFESEHLAEAVNNCVYEVAFEERLADCAPDRRKPTVVYGPDGECASAAAAVEKLVLAGFSDVRKLQGGLAAAKEAGLETKKGTPVAEPPVIADGRHEVDTEKSALIWTGRNLLNHHFGTVAIRCGGLDFRAGKLTGGSFEIDLAAIRCTDLAGTKDHDSLVRHLQSIDFFDVKNHPVAKLEIRAVQPVEHATPGAPNLRITADLEIRGSSHSLEFDAVAGISSEGKAVAQAVFSLDRTKWNVRYGAGKLFRRLGGHLVNDLIEFQVKIVTR